MDSAGGRRQLSHVVHVDKAAENVCMFVCVSLCVCVRARACVRERVCARACAYARACVSVKSSARAMTIIVHEYCISKGPKVWCMYACVRIIMAVCVGVHACVYV